MNLDGEQWERIPGFDDPRYWISSTGRVMRELVTPLNVRTGYRSISLSRGRKAVTRTVYSLVANVFLGPMPRGATLVRHLDGNKLNNDRKNLAYGVERDNWQDFLSIGGLHHLARRTHCPHGHEYTPENTRMYARPGGKHASRYCLACGRARVKRRSTT
jgi:hypothetical protein